MDENIKEAIELAKKVLKATTEDTELYEIVALNARLTFDALVKQGFSDEQAVALTAAVMKNK